MGKSKSCYPVTGVLSPLEYKDFLFCKGALAATNNTEALRGLIKVATPLLKSEPQQGLNP